MTLIQCEIFFLEIIKSYSPGIILRLSRLKYRENFVDYLEVYLKAPLELVKKRDPKNLYKKYYAGIEKNIVGLDIPWHEPKESDIEINMEEALPIDMIVKKISSKIKLFKNISLESNEN